MVSKVVKRVELSTFLVGLSEALSAFVSLTSIKVKKCSIKLLKEIVLGGNTMFFQHKDAIYNLFLLFSTSECGAA